MTNTRAQTVSERIRDRIREEIAAGRGANVSGTAVAKEMGVDPTLARRITKQMRDCGELPSMALPEAAAVKRINVAVSPETVRALQAVMAREEVSLTEAVRRLLGYGEYLYRAIRENGETVQVRRGDRVTDVVLLP